MLKEKLSASKITLYNSCSWSFYCRYMLKLPNQTSIALTKGTITHTVLEILLKDKHKEKVETSIKAKKLNKSIVRYIKLLCKSQTEEFINDVISFTLNALLFDFLCVNSNKIVAEEAFELKGRGYIAVGKIDKIAYFDNRVAIFDYKTSKQKFDKTKSEFNIQAFMYALYVYKKYKVLPEVNFVFLRFKKKPFQQFTFTENQLNGFDAYLTYMSKKVNKFDITDAVSNFAADTSERFLMCGKHLGAQNLNGDDSSVCEYKYPKMYFAGYDRNKKLIKTAYNKSDLTQIKEIITIEQMEYKGCPKFVHLW